MKKNRISLVSLLFVFTIISCTPPSTEPETDLSSYTKETVSADDLANWNFQGLGKAFNAGGNQFCLMEADSTFGVVLISPKAYDGDVIVRYKTLALTTPTVMVFMHSASNIGSDEDLTIPEDYNGNMGFWMTNCENYFYAFKNASHNFTPFIRKYPVPGNESLVSAKENFMVPGKYYAIEIGRIDNTLWLSIDGKKILETTDDTIYNGGYLAFRLRGTAGFKAACLIKDMEIYS